MLKRVESFSDDPVRSAIKVHEKLARTVMELEQRIAVVVTKLKERGLESPYLRSFVVARVNPLRWMKGELPPADKVLQTMLDRAAKFDVEKIRQQDLTAAGGPAPEE